MASDKETASLVPLIDEIRSRPLGGVARTGTLALISAVPYAGGAIASVVGEFATNRRFERVCEVLSDLNSRLENAGGDPEEHLSKDQIVEVVYETLQTATTASDNEKLAALKNGLGYAFLSPDPFERKQVFLQVLRPTTSLELRLLARVYDGVDPYIVKTGGPEGDTAASAMQVAALAGSWVPVRNAENCDRPKLIDHLADEVSVTKGDLEGVARLLDGKGLTFLESNLKRTDCKVVEWQELAGSLYAGTRIGGGGMLADVIKGTPLEESQTDFGKAFLEFCRGA